MKQTINSVLTASLLIFVFLVHPLVSQETKGKKENNLEERMSRLEEKVETRTEQPDFGYWGKGKSKILARGVTFMKYTDEEGTAGEFTGGLKPVFLWKYGDRLLFESKFVAEYGGHDTQVDLHWGMASYIVNDYLTVGTGKFLMPVGPMRERLHPEWINKFADQPLDWQHHGGFVPNEGLGIQARGGFRFPDSEMKMNYTTYLINGPKIEGHGHHMGELEFGTSGDNNSNKALGARVGFLPVPELEVGVSAMSGRSDNNGTQHFEGHGWEASTGENMDTNLLGVDLSYTKSSSTLSGTLKLYAEYSQLETENPNPIIAAPGEPVDGNTFYGGEDITRTASYIQLSYRPDKLDSALQNLEGVVRYDVLDQPDHNPDGTDAENDLSRVTIGTNYWLNPTTAVKIGYAIENHDDPEAEANSLLAELVYGF